MENKEQKKLIINAISELLKPKGFKKSGDRFYLEIYPGYVQIIDFTLGPNWSSVSDKIDVGSGIFIQELHDILQKNIPTKILTSAHGELRDIYNSDIRFNWIPIRNEEEAIIQIKEYITKIVLPYFEIYNSAEQIIDRWYKFGNNIGLPPRGKLSVAILLWNRNKKEEAEKLIKEEISQTQNSSYKTFVKEISNQLGIKING